jgi:mitochondrial fission protein ELM1
MSCINILWLKDGKPGHEKQVKVLLDEISKSKQISVYEKVCPKAGSISKILQSMTLFGDKYKYLAKFANDRRRVKLCSDEIELILKNNIDLIIGAGSTTQLQMLRFKEYFEYKNIKDLKIISVLTPSIHKNYFDIICAPEHDNYKFSPINNNIIYYKGALAKVSNITPEENLGFIGIGGKNNHYLFNEDKLIKQIEYIITLYPNFQWNLFTSRRTMKSMSIKIDALLRNYTNLEIDQGNIDNFIENASFKIVTQDSVSMLYECLSTKGDTYVFNMKYRKDNKITRQINDLIKNEQIGYISYQEMANGLMKMNLKKRNIHYDVFAEVEKVSFQLINKLGL